jgi:hypothetical protein
MTASNLIAMLPPEKGEETVIVKRQDTDDIIKEVLAAHTAFSPDYDKICDEFSGAGTPRRLFNFCKRNLQYDVEDEKTQTTRSPAVLLKMGHCDCKGYAGFVAGVLDGLNRSGHGSYNWKYRFANYEDPEESPGHVFVVTTDERGKETWIDPVLSEFNQRDPLPTDWVDKARPMTLVRMSGVEAKPAASALRSTIAGPLSAYRMGTMPASGFTADQLGIPIMQAVFTHWGSEYPQAVATLASNPPVRFFLGNAQIQLPPPVTYGGQPVPLIPNGLRVVWDSTFMGLPIPADMLNIAVSNGVLTVSPLEIVSAGGTGADTNNFLYNTHRYLLFLFLGVLENLIYSYSSWPWGNGFNDLSQQLNSARNYYNWLVYPGANKKTWFGNVLQQASKVETAIAPIEGAVLNLVVPGFGGVIANAAAAGLAAATGSNKPANYGDPTNVISTTAPPLGIVTDPTDGSAVLPTGSVSLTSVADTVTQFAAANPLPAVAIAAGIAYLLYEIFSD